MSEHTLLGAALITGASTGIGAVYADRLARRGHDLILVARDVPRLEALAMRLHEAAGVKVEVLAADLTDPGDLAKVAGRVAGPDVGVLLNNAGAALFTSTIDSEPAALDRLIQLNLVAVTHLARAAAKAFSARGSGTIINVGSVVGLWPEFRNAVYGATKAYVLYLTQGLSCELEGKGVRFQAVLPGATRTEIWERAGGSIDYLDPSRVMDADDLVDAALAALDAGELVTIPSLPDAADWEAFEAARKALGPNLSHDRPAARFGVKA